jgi:hypothetical protein
MSLQALHFQFPFLRNKKCRFVRICHPLNHQTQVLQLCRCNLGGEVVQFMLEIPNRTSHLLISRPAIARLTLSTDYNMRGTSINIVVASACERLGKSSSIERACRLVYEIDSFEIPLISGTSGPFRGKAKHIYSKKHRCRTLWYQGTYPWSFQPHCHL